MEKIKIFIKGIIIGCASILPGISGGTMALSLGIYEKLIKIASNIFIDFKENLKFLVPIFLGAGTGVVLLSNVITIGLEKHALIMTLLFVGLMLGGIPSLLSKVKKNTLNINNIILSIIAFVVVLFFVLVKEPSTEVAFTNINISTYLTLIVIGIIAAGTMVVPGISGSLILMLMGYYSPIVKAISQLLKFDQLGHNLQMLIPFGIGVLVGIVLISKIINYFLKKYYTQTYYVIYGIILASIIGILIPLEAGIAVIVMFAGIFIAYKVGD